VFAAAALLLGACATDSYDGVDANYDAIKSASNACQASGGELRLKSGYDGRTLSDFTCVKDRAR
jgi:hypothetical protein